jgi:hypothetical protein
MAPGGADATRLANNGRLGPWCLCVGFVLRLFLSSARITLARITLANLGSLLTIYHTEVPFPFCWQNEMQAFDWA